MPAVRRSWLGARAGADGSAVVVASPVVAVVVVVCCLLIFLPVSPMT